MTSGQCTAACLVLATGHCMTANTSSDKLPQRHCMMLSISNKNLPQMNRLYDDMEALQSRPPNIWNDECGMITAYVHEGTCPQRSDAGKTACYQRVAS